MLRRVIAVVLIVIVVVGFTYTRNRQKRKEAAAMAANRESVQAPADMGLIQNWLPNSMTLEEIFNIDIKENLVARMGVYVGERCDFGDNMPALTHAERVIYIVTTLEGEVNNGGFAQYFYNSSGNQANELVDAFTEIGAPQTAAICEKALSVFGGRVPEDWDERNEVFDALDEDLTDEILCECDDAFYDYGENLADLCYQYIMKNKDQFR